ncbi:hypothetical protein PC116_g12329 [Phytophthora cactorum]|uniref:Uncharacterized protein n=1 Tax=Phytophthora cactorum TaxID=29920 RepID=A0A8T1KSA5_9STRA|nr:hypothetical protein Pcac1_g27185 [Phytophthora cactorum]KAG2938588.1 hypothetical protein PC117_g11135 [Phytophthora cactorum]KAG3016057.1 hypothetical protein PC119_g11499 [Phytophthora cactorum]KAG3167932.1 hypothetical protein C6341_g11549 [Phytophthora cactorum]KAG4039461.1 hypothetical protein PC123_g24989 [Phytophthora cactorum]
MEKDIASNVFMPCGRLCPFTDCIRCKRKKFHPNIWECQTSVLPWQCCQISV